MNRDTFFSKSVIIQDVKGSELEIRDQRQVLFLF